MSLLCHISNFLYPKESFIDPNELYTRDDNCFNKLEPKYSVHFQKELQQQNNECPNRHKDPCKDVLFDQHFQIQQILPLNSKCGPSTY